MDIRSNMLLISSTKDTSASNVWKLIGASTSAMVSSLGDSTSCDVKASQKSGFLSLRPTGKSNSFFIFMDAQYECDGGGIASWALISYNNDL